MTTGSIFNPVKLYWWVEIQSGGVILIWMGDNAYQVARKQFDEAMRNANSLLLAIDDYIYAILSKTVLFHDDFIKWKYFPQYWPFYEGNPPVTGEFPSQGPVTRRFDVSFHLRLNKRLSKQSKHQRFETPSRSLWRHCNVFRRWIICTESLAVSRVPHNFEFPCQAITRLQDIHNILSCRNLIQNSML